MPESLEAAFAQLRDRRRQRRGGRSTLQTALVVPVFTAHPSEARRRTILEKLETISRLLDRLEYSQLLPHERRAAESAVAEELETFWLSSLVRSERPSVLDEVRQGLGMVAGLFEVVPRIYREMEAALGRWYPELADVAVPTFLRFGSWIGGDRDGNPHRHARRHRRVGPTCSRRRSSAIICARVEELGGKLSQSAAFLGAVRRFREALRAGRRLVPEADQGREHEPYRSQCRVIAARLRRTLNHARGRGAALAGGRSTAAAGNLHPAASSCSPTLQPSPTTCAAAGAEAAAAGRIHDLCRWSRCSGCTC